MHNYRKYLLALSATAALTSGPALADAAATRVGVPALDHVFVLVLENHNAATSFGSEGIIGNPNAPHINALATEWNYANNYNAVRHPSLPNYVSMITGDWVGTDVVATGHSYPPGSKVGISDDDSPSVATDYPVPPAKRRFIAGWCNCRHSPASSFVAARTGGRICRISLMPAQPWQTGQETTIQPNYMRSNTTRFHT